MKRLIINLLILAIVPTLSLIPPSCDIVHQIGTIPLLPQENLYIDLLSIFSGYNLDVTSNADSATIVDPVNQISSLPLLSPIPSDAIWSTVKPQSDWNLIWQSKVALVYQKSLNSVFVNLGLITDLKNFNFNSTAVQINFQNETRCFDAEFIDSEHLAIDCQTVGTSSLTMVVFTMSQSKIYNLNGVLTANSRKLLKYRTPDGKFRLLSVVNGVDQISKGSEYIAVLKVKQMYGIEQEAVINAGTFKKDSLSIKDAVVDSTGHIYVSQKDSNSEGVTRFKYQNGQVMNSTVQSFSILKDANVSKLALANINNEQHLFVLMNQGVLRLIQGKFINGFFSLPPEIIPLNIYVNQNILVIQTSDTLYQYPLNQNYYKLIIKAIPFKNSLITLEPSSDRAVILTSDKTLAYSLTDGYLLLKYSDQDVLLTLTATSTNSNNDSISCILNITLKATSDVNEVLQTKSLQDKITAESPVEIKIPLDEYFVGSRLSFSGTPDKDANYNIKHVQQLNIPPPKIKQTIVTKPALYASTSISYFDYLRLVYLNKTISVQKCTLEGAEVKSVPFYSEVVANQLSQVRIGQILKGGKWSQTIAYTTNQDISTINLIDITQSSKKSISVGKNFVAISDFQLSKFFLIVAVRSLSTLFIYSHQNYEKALFTIDLKFFNSEQIEEIKTFKPRLIHIVPESNLIYIVNLDSVIVLQISESSVSFIANIRMSQNIDATTQWDISATKTNLLAVFASTNKVHNYRILNTYQYKFLGDLELFQQTISVPLKVSTTNDFVFIGTSGNSVTTIRINQPSLAANYHLTKINQNNPIWFLATELDGNSILQVREISSSNYENRLFYYNPTIIITTGSHQKDFKTQYNIKLKVSGVTKTIFLSTKLQVFNYQTILEEKETSYEKLWLPGSASSEKVYLDLNSFRGGVVSYRIECPYCGTKIQLIQPLNKTSSIEDIQFNDYLNFDGGVVWMLTNDTIYYSKNDGATSQPFKLNINFKTICSKLIQIDNHNILVFCQASDGQQFVSIKADTQFKPIQTNTFPIDASFVISKIHKTIYQNNWLYVLDNNKLGSGLGLIRVFRVSTNQDGSVNSTIPSSTVNSNSFSVPFITPIQGFQIIKIGNDSQRVMICTINDGIGYANFDSLMDFSLKDPRFYNLNKDSLIADYILEGNKYLQLKFLFKILKTDDDSYTYSYTFLLTVTTGAHLQIGFEFQPSLQIKKIDIVNSFNKYGAQNVSNVLLYTPYSATHQNLFFVPYSNSTNQKITFAMYKIPETDTSSAISFKSAVEVKSWDIPNAFLYRNSTQNARFLLSSPSSTLLSKSSFEAYDATQSLGLLMDYSSGGSFDSLTVKAYNQYSFATHKIDLQFEEKIGIRWYTIVLFIIGGLILMGMTFGVFKYIKKRRDDEKKISLVTEDADNI